MKPLWPVYFSVETKINMTGRSKFQTDGTPVPKID